MRNFLLFFLLLNFLTACQPEKNSHPIQFYYWKSNVNFGETERTYFEALNSEKLYVRLFDVVIKEGRIEPTALVQKFDTQKLKADFVPVVYIINEVFQGISKNEIKKLAKDVQGLVQSIANENGFDGFVEIQIDCDWTASTRDNYFLFLNELRNIAQKNISSTLRLHQVKFKTKTGIPPADKVYLMCYATSNPIEEVEKNSILDLELLKDYLKDIDQYPLKIDVALPIYSWAIATNHLGKKKLINGVTESDVKNENFREINEGLYEVTTDTFLRGVYLNQGFTVKPENISSELLTESRRFLDAKIQSDFDIVYYHLDSLFLSNYNIQDLQ
ncbi:MAG: hypothetical protein WDA08_03510 [Weeksellaceae bacterium]